MHVRRAPPSVRSFNSSLLLLSPGVIYQEPIQTMPASSNVPTSYSSRWRANGAQTTSPSSANPHSPAAKYNTSCNACRKARVKCSGGKPCRKCAASAAPESCVYSVSRRRGKRKASDVRHPEAATAGNPTPEGDPLDIAAFDPLLMQGWPGPGDDLWPDPLSWHSHAVSSLFQQVPPSRDATDIFIAKGSPFGPITRGR